MKRKNGRNQHSGASSSKDKSAAHQEVITPSKEDEVSTPSLRLRRKGKQGAWSDGKIGTKSKPPVDAPSTCPAALKVYSRRRHFQDVDEDDSDGSGEDDDDVDEIEDDGEDLVKVPSLPMQRKIKRKKMELPTNYMIEQQAYFAGIDAFELVEEEDE